MTDEKHRDYGEHITGNSSLIALDEKELQLLKLIAKDSRASLLKLSQQLGITPAAVKYVLKKLEREKVILAYKVTIDFNKLGYHYYKIDLELE